MAANRSQHAWDLSIITTGMSNNTYSGVPPLWRPTGGDALVEWNIIQYRFGYPGGRYANMIANAPAVVPSSAPHNFMPHAPGFGAATYQPHPTFAVAPFHTAHAFGAAARPHPAFGAVPIPLPQAQNHHVPPPRVLQTRVQHYHEGLPTRRRTLKPSHAIQKARRRARQQGHAPLAFSQLHGSQAHHFAFGQHHLASTKYHFALGQHPAASSPSNPGQSFTTPSQASLVTRPHLSRRQRADQRRQQRSREQGFTLPRQQPPRFRRYGTLAMGYGERGRGVKGLNDAEADARVGESFGGSTSGSGRRPQSVRHSGVGGITNVAMDERAFQLPD